MTYNFIVFMSKKLFTLKKSVMTINDIEQNKKTIIYGEDIVSNYAK